MIAQTAAAETPAFNPIPTVYDLPFVSPCSDGTKDLWVVETAGNWAADCDTGARHGAALIAFMQQTENPSIFGLVVQRIAEHGAWSGVECGFLHTIAEATLR
jgi:hypothetical protein